MFEPGDPFFVSRHTTVVFLVGLRGVQHQFCDVRLRLCSSVLKTKKNQMSLARYETWRILVTYKILRRHTHLFATFFSFIGHVVPQDFFVCLAKHAARQPIAASGDKHVLARGF